MGTKRAAFTLIEVLIAIALMGLILPPLYKSVDLLRDSNDQLKEHLEKSEAEAKALKALFLDIASSDGNLTITNGEFDRLCIEHTIHSLYDLFHVKVCWLVLREGHRLVRVEGKAFHLPTGLEEETYTDTVFKDMVLFDITRDEQNVLVVLQQKHKEPVAFLVEAVTAPKKKKTKKPLKKKKATATVTQETNTSTPTSASDTNTTTS